MRQDKKAESVTELRRSEWFRHEKDDGQRFLKMSRFQDGDTLYEAVNVSTGFPAFPVGEDSGPLIVVETPHSLRLRQGVLRYRKVENRDNAFGIIKSVFSNIRFSKDQGDGYYYIKYQAVLEVHEEIMDLYQGRLGEGW